MGTVITRFLPPILFPHAGRVVDGLIEAKGEVYQAKQHGFARLLEHNFVDQSADTLLPPAMMGLLLVYSLRNVSFASAGQWLPECIAIAVTAGLHLWRRNSLLSIAGGTITYMLLVQVVFA